MDLPLINSVPEAIDFLRSIGVEVVGIWHGWILHDAAGEFQLQLSSNAELIERARYERDMCRKLCAELGVDSLAEFLAEGEHSSAADGYPREAWPSEEDLPPASNRGRQ